MGTCQGHPESHHVLGWEGARPAPSSCQCVVCGLQPCPRGQGGPLACYLCSSLPNSGSPPPRQPGFWGGTQPGRRVGGGLQASCLLLTTERQKTQHLSQHSVGRSFSPSLCFLCPQRYTVHKAGLSSPSGPSLWGHHIWPVSEAGPQTWRAARGPAATCSREATTLGSAATFCIKVPCISQEKPNALGWKGRGCRSTEKSIHQSWLLLVCLARKGSEPEHRELGFASCGLPM